LSNLARISREIAPDQESAVVDNWHRRSRLFGGIPGLFLGDVVAFSTTGKLKRFSPCNALRGLMLDPLQLFFEPFPTAGFRRPCRAIDRDNIPNAIVGIYPPLYSHLFPGTHYF
jgi:hypothetical protein